MKTILFSIVLFLSFNGCSNKQEQDGKIIANDIIDVAIPGNTAADIATLVKDISRVAAEEYEAAQHKKDIK